MPERRVGLARRRHTTRQVVRGRRRPRRRAVRDSARSCPRTSPSRPGRARGGRRLGHWCRARAHRGTGFTACISSGRR
ncbi:MAG: hypothetical protein E6K82_01450 [Candidatus Rokuibacteriota bacterium]|nr:MAG: hypothetical protein E6K82_01450 [Candidatus Rokubacteria bacterium]